MSRKLVMNIGQLATPVGKAALHGADMSRIRVLKDAAMLILDGKIAAVGPQAEVLAQYQALPAEIRKSVGIIDAKGHAVVPGFVDSHTHFIFGGYRPEEFIRRLQGATYMEIMEMGGGIRCTVTATREASEEELYELGRARVRQMLSQGITTVEGKTGYGLDHDTELRMIRVMKRLDAETPEHLAITYLGAHAVADEFAGKPEAYVKYMIEEVMPDARREGAEFADVFCEKGVFSTEQSETILKAAASMGYKLKIHADEIVSTGGAELAAELGCLSADHLLAASEEGIAALAKSQTVATLLPCTAFCLGAKYADGRKMIDEGCAVALASDYNPGSCFTQSVPLMAALGAIQMNMKPQEVLTALTLNGAAALGRADRTGSLEVGKDADFNILSFDDYLFLIYETGMNVVESTFIGGEKV